MAILSRVTNVKTSRKNVSVPNTFQRVENIVTICY